MRNNNDDVKEFLCAAQIKFVLNVLIQKTLQPRRSLRLAGSELNDRVLSELFSGRSLSSENIKSRQNHHRCT
jgi:hypothetical protein